MNYNLRGMFAIATAVLFISGLCSCSDNKSNEEPVKTVTEINVSPESVTFDAAGGEKNITVTSNADWSLRSEADWVKVFPGGGLKGTATDVKITAVESKEFETRNALLVIKSGEYVKNINVVQSAPAMISVDKTSLNAGSEAAKFSLTVTSNVAWSAAVSDSWCKLAPAAGEAGETVMTVECEANTSGSEREAQITIEGGAKPLTVKLVQYTDVIATPEGYSLVWNDEFNTADGSMPDTDKWYYDIWPAGYVNNELQRYVAGEANGVKTAQIANGILSITAAKAGNEVLSARLNTKELFLYGYFEARLKLPKGKGTWPAFWMMPADGGNWPHCGEIDIMEEVGVNPNYTSSSIHCTAYNHVIGTQKTKERFTAGAEDEFHVYALEWTPDFIRTYIDGQELFYFANDKKNDENTWPFNKPFHPILNLAWGGSWGGMSGVDESALPAVYEIDYVRIFQK
ncbi:MAG: family 16 glycosylhydrolase [Muribaculaceae bacterium]|nr:family 16 glycosylhydrolase [Muribaculaceae bacterium]